MTKGFSKDELRDFAMCLFVQAYVRAPNRVEFLYLLFSAIDSAEIGDDDDWKQIGLDDFLAALSGRTHGAGCAYAYTVLVKLLAEHMLERGTDHTDFHSGPLWLTRSEVGPLGRDERKYVALGQMVIEDARVEVEAFDFVEDGE